MNFKDKRVLVIDGGGLFVSLAYRLTEFFGEVGYFVEWQSSSPDEKELIIGYGLPGINRIKRLWQEIDNYDLIVFPDVFHGDWQDWLRAHGYRVWGCGMKGELELARWETKSILGELNLPLGEAHHVIGISNLREFLQQPEHEDVFVKVSTFRGLGETFEAKNYTLVKGLIDEMEAEHEAIANMLGFIVEKKIPNARELGYDGYCVEREFPNQAFFGAEIKDAAYFGKLVDYGALPPEIRKVNTELSYRMDGFRGFFSTELRDDKLIDITARHASPGGETMIHAMTNLAEVLWFGAEGKLVHGEYSHKFVAQIILNSEWAEKHDAIIEFPEELRPWMKLYHHCRTDGHDRVVPQIAKMKQVGSVIGLGNTPEETVKLCKERAEQVHGFDLETEADALDKAVSEMDGT